MIGYKNIPITGSTSKGLMTIVVGTTYVRYDNTVEILDQWINEACNRLLDTTDRVIFMTAAAVKLSKTLSPITEKDWKGVIYG